MSKIISIMFIVSLVLFVILLIIHFVFTKNHKYIIKQFRKSNVFVYGKKGTGKDLVFQWVINKRKHDKYNHYHSNLSYGGHYHHIKLKDISCMPNTFENFINDNIQTINNCLYENEDIYLSDIGIYLPAQYDSMLHKKYPSMPIYYATSRHNAHHNIHCNVQNFERAWKALREQADFYINTKETVKVFNLLITTGYFYEKLEAATKSILPMKKSLFAKDAEKAAYKQFVSTYGRIEKFTIIQRIKNIKYDTRAFRKILYGDLPLKDRLQLHKIAKKRHREFHRCEQYIKKHSLKYFG